MIKVIGIVKRKEGLTFAEFSIYWAEHHAPLLRKTVPEDIMAGLPRYVQNHAVQMPGGGSAPYDGVGEICFDSMESLKKWNEWYFGEGGKVLHDDEENFMERSKTIVIVTEEKVQVPVK